MKCPLSGKACLYPKEIFVTEVNKDGIKRLFLCKGCGEGYIRTLSPDADIVTKSLEVRSTGNDIAHHERIIDEPLLPVEKPAEAPRLVSTSVNAMRQIVQVENKLKAAIDREDYESAAKLRDILAVLKKNMDEVDASDEDE